MPRANTRLLIINAAVKLFASHGFEKTAVDDIAAEAKVAKGTIFYNFKTKNDIFLAILRAGIDDLTRTVHKKVGSEGTATEKIEAVFDASVEFLQKYGSFYNVLISELGRIHSHWKVEPMQLLDPYLQVVEKILEDGQQSGEFRRDIPPKEMGMIIFLAVASSGLGKVMMVGDEEVPLFTPTKQIVLRGIKNPG